MELQFFTERVLLQRLKSDNNGLTFLFGSAFSAIKDGSGIPNVRQVSEIIEEYASEQNLLDYYKEHIQEYNEKDRYQESFALLSAVKGALSTREIVTRVVMNNFDAETEKHLIPKAIQEFVKCIKEKKIKVKNIITTNFDTLIEEQFKNEGILYNSISIVSDSNIIDNSNGYINIIHLHGVWDKGDTMHTRNQLESKREKIEASLQSLLREQSVVVMAYSGWVDSFTRTLASIVNDDKAEYNLAWCFYEKKDAIIEKNDKQLFETLTSAINRDRIQFFNGIDCNTLFSNLLSESIGKKKEMKIEN
jgi:RNA:NAD 2'-phosphotransferase (TPT1/KptA family)